MWEAWKLSQAYRALPSEVYRVEDEVTAWCFDRAVWLFGSSVEAELNEAVRGSKKPQQAIFRQMQVLQRWGLGKMQFRDPAAGSSKPQEPTDVTSDDRGVVQL